jgi:hypothetical protein
MGKLLIILGMVVYVFGIFRKHASGHDNNHRKRKY